jgi:hypothetical protein
MKRNKKWKVRKKKKKNKIVLLFDLVVYSQNYLFFILCCLIIKLYIIIIIYFIALSILSFNVFFNFNTDHYIHQIIVILNYISWYQTRVKTKSIKKYKYSKDI